MRRPGLEPETTAKTLYMQFGFDRNFLLPVPQILIRGRAGDTSGFLLVWPKGYRGPGQSKNPGASSKALKEKQGEIG